MTRIQRLMVAVCAACCVVMIASIVVGIVVWQQPGEVKALVAACSAGVLAILALAASS